MTTPGYFASPSPVLDPHLFTGDILSPEVRSFVTRTTLTAFRDFGLTSVRRWLSIWLTGSGVSYQWGNGDLDVIIGVDYGRFTKANPEFAGVDHGAVAADANKWLKKNVWNLTRSVSFGGSEYEVTFFWAADAGMNVEHIHPYAAYDVLHNKWVIRPPQLPANPMELYSPEWQAATDRDTALAGDISARYKRFSGLFKRAVPTSPGAHNAGHTLNLVAAQARALYNEIHQGRREAFGEQGRGYRDYYNYRHQRAKATGVYDMLRPILAESRKAQREKDTELYGAPITGHQDALRRAALWNSGRAG